MTCYSFIKTLNSVLCLLITVCYGYQFLYLFLPKLLKKPRFPEATPKRYGILIAARNEEAVLPHLLDSIRNQNYPAELISVYVVADNCTDGTAAVARAAGACCYSRFDPIHVGKGYALNYLLERLRQDGLLEQQDAFLVFDADNLLDRNYVSEINRLCSEGYQAFCGYRNTKNFGTNWISSGYALWHLHESVHMNRSRMAIGSSCVTSGTGFGFTRSLLERIGGWNFFTLTEDSEFNAWCYSHDVQIGYCHDAIIYDEQPITFRQSWRQRTRWAQGGFQVAGKYTPDLFRAICRGSKTGYACFETLTLLPWGYALSLLCFFLTLVVAYGNHRWPGLLQALWTSLQNAYTTLFLIGGWTVATEWKRIRGTLYQKLGSLFTFPLFMLTYVPIAIAAPFRKFEWKPIVHSIAISANQLQK